jgi:hypothetical protein
MKMGGVLIKMEGVLIKMGGVFIKIEEVLIKMGGVFIKIEEVLIKMEGVFIKIEELIKIEGVLIKIEGVFIKIEGVLIKIPVVSPTRRSWWARTSMRSPSRRTSLSSSSSVCSQRCAPGLGSVSQSLSIWQPFRSIHTPQ